MTADERDRVMTWRREERQRLIAARLALSVAERVDLSERISARLRPELGTVQGRCISAYWPLRGEPDLRDLLRGLCESGARCVLPVVVEKGQPLLFRQWTPGCVMARGIWDIPFPADGEVLVPEVLLAPVVGFDPCTYRLGYGGGYFDRTLAALRTPRRVIGVGYEFAALATIYPLSHDVPMDAIVTESRVWRPPAERPVVADSYFKTP